jgi:acyl carrier protein
MTTQDKVIAILADQAMIEISDVALDNTLDDLGIDSMSLVETIFAIEEAFDVSVPFNANAPDEGGFDISTVASIVAAVDKLKAQDS